MGIRKDTEASAWDECVRRASVATAAEQPGGQDEGCWDFVAIRDIIAVVLYSLHLRDGQPVKNVPWNSVLWHLRDDDRVNTLAHEVLPPAGHCIDLSAESDDLVVERWRWLTRTWDPDAPVRPRKRQPPPWGKLFQSDRSERPEDAEEPEPRWGGLSRGIGSGLPDPALEVCTSWAAHVVQAIIMGRNGGYATFQRVHVVDGPLKGHRGYVTEPGWAFDDEAQTVEGPAGYVVDLDDTEGTERIDAHQLTARRDHRWPQRPRGTLKDGPPPGLHDPLPPHPSCAEDLEAILTRASNPQDVPDDLRGAIAAAFAHHHLDMGSGASPEPNRVSWRIVQHWYQLTEHYTEGQIADVWEVIFKRHLHDSDPVVYLALSELEAQAVIALRGQRV